MTQQRFKAKRVIVTGAASGIGEATARLFAANGAAVVCADVNVAAARNVAGSLAHAHAVEFDAADAASCKTMIATASQRLGGLDVLCNIAGIMDWDPLPQFTEARWDRMLAINLSSVFHTSRYAMPHLMKSKGNIVVRVPNPTTSTLRPWPAYDMKERATMELGATCTVTHDPRSPRRILLRRILGNS